MSQRVIVLDLETKLSADEVGGWDNLSAMGVSVVGVYSYWTNRHEVFWEGGLDRLAIELRTADLVVGFNLIAFDWPVLAAELGDWVRELPTLDLLAEVQKSLGHRLSLNHLAKETLGASKLGSGLDALKYYRQGDWEKLQRYCLEDVRLTRRLYDHARKWGYLRYRTRDGRQAKCELSL